MLEKLLRKVLGAIETLQSIVRVPRACFGYQIEISPDISKTISGEIWTDGKISKNQKPK